MSEPGAPRIGDISWTDLTVPDAARIRDFHARAVGWRIGEVEMGGYQDDCMNEPAGAATALFEPAGTANGGQP